MLYHLLSGRREPTSPLSPTANLASRIAHSSIDNIILKKQIPLLTCWESSPGKAQTGISVLDSQITPLTACVTNVCSLFPSTRLYRSGNSLSACQVRLWALYRLPDECLPFLSLCGELGSSTFFFLNSPKIFETSPFLAVLVQSVCTSPHAS